MRVRVFLAVIFALLIIPAVAHAKGPDQATIDGTGMSAPASISGTEGASGDLSTLVELAGLFLPCWARPRIRCSQLRPTRSSDPSCRSRWRIPDGDPRRAPSVRTSTSTPRGSADLYSPRSAVPRERAHAGRLVPDSRCVAIEVGCLRAAGRDRGRSGGPPGGGIVDAVRAVPVTGSPGH